MIKTFEKRRFAAKHVLNLQIRSVSINLSQRITPKVTFSSESTGMASRSIPAPRLPASNGDALVPIRLSVTFSRQKATGFGGAKPTLPTMAVLQNCLWSEFNLPFPVTLVI
jgi:hypothetical protein